MTHDPTLGACVLVIDDEASNRMLLSSWLKSRGYIAREAKSGDEGLALVAAGGVDLVLLDIVMPGLDGFRVLEKIRQGHSLNELPVIMLTARDGADDIIQAFRLGANDYARKPVDFDLLGQRVGTHLSVKLGVPHLGPFALLRKLGSGGMGVVYAAEKPGLARPVALKVLHRSLTYDDEYVARFLREAKLAERIHHPNVVQLIETGRLAETYYLAMELVDGANAYELATQRPVDLATTLRIGRQVALGLEALAMAGIVHRDVKPENILVTPTGEAKITDFGIARDLGAESRLTEPGIGFGSLAYISPEQMTGSGDHRADIYGLGSTLFFMATGVDPFDSGKAPITVLEEKLRSAPRADAMRPGLPDPVVQLLADMMAPRERDRIQTYGEVIAEIDRILPGLPASRLGTPVSSNASTWYGDAPSDAAQTPVVAAPTVVTDPHEAASAGAAPPAKPALPAAAPAAEARSLGARAPGPSPVVTALLTVAAIAALVALLFLVLAP